MNLHTIDKVVHFLHACFFFEVRVLDLLLTLSVECQIVYFSLPGRPFVLAHELTSRLLLVEFKQFALVLIVEFILVIDEELLEDPGRRIYFLRRVDAVHDGVLSGLLSLVQIVVRCGLNDGASVANFRQERGLALDLLGNVLHALVASLWEKLAASFRSDLEVRHNLLLGVDGVSQLIDVVNVTILARHEGSIYQL